MNLIVVSTLYQVTNIGGPVFTKSLEKLVLVVQTSTVYELPAIMDPDNDNYTVTANLMTASIFTVFKYPYFQLKPNAENAGNYSISIKLTD